MGPFVKVTLGVLVLLMVFQLSGCQSAVQYDLQLYPDLVEEVIAIELPEVALETEGPMIEEPLDTKEWTLIKPNELGEIMIVMYHRLAANEGVYDRSVENFKADLERLYNEGYRPVALGDVVAGRIDLPAGLSPVVLTFDDGHVSNFKFLEDGETIDPNCVVGVFLAFQETHPDFKPRAIFYLTGPTPFGQQAMVEKKLKRLVELGFEIGNHTTSHDKLSTLNPEQISAEIGVMNAKLENSSGHAITHLSLPYGLRPKSEAGVAALSSSAQERYTYLMASIVNVGWKPVVSPYHMNFTPLSLNRVICGEGDYSMHYWMDYFKRHPKKRFVSDGDPDYLSVLEPDEVLIAEHWQEVLHIRTYTQEE